jgi:hypothetical protein
MLKHFRGIRHRDLLPRYAEPDVHDALMSLQTFALPAVEVAVDISKALHSKPQDWV